MRVDANPRKGDVFRRGNERVRIYPPKVVGERREVECPNLAQGVMLKTLNKLRTSGRPQEICTMHDVFVALAFLAMVVVLCSIANRSGSSAEKN